MEQLTVRELAQDFNKSANKTEDEVEFWYARDLQKSLGYGEWRNFLNVIQKAKESCKKAGFQPSHNFVDVNKIVETGVASKPIKDERNNKDVRDLLDKSNIKPENLPPSEDVKKVERRVNAEKKKLNVSANAQKLLEGKTSS